MQLMTMIYTNQMAESVAFFERLGLVRSGEGDIDQWWNEFAIGDAKLALHWNQDQPIEAGVNPELHFNVDGGQLDGLFAAFQAAGSEMSAEIQTLSGMETRTFFVTDPNGIKVFING